MIDGNIFCVGSGSLLFDSTSNPVTVGGPQARVYEGIATVT
jgi:hypothetical protein